jgi:hypothetical protein
LEESDMGVISLTRYLRGRFSDRRPPGRFGAANEQPVPPGEQRFTSFEQMDAATARVAAQQQEPPRSHWDQAETPGAQIGVQGESGFWVSGGVGTPLERTKDGWRASEVGHEGLAPDGVPRR